MAKLEDVIKALEQCGDGKHSCDGCPYDIKSAKCLFLLHSDALGLLKEQEAVKPKSKTRHGSTTMVQHWCGNCMVMLHGKPKYCPNCGRKVKWE